MGKRKSSKPPPKKQRPKLDVAFNCPFCNSSKSVTATLDYDAEVTSAPGFSALLTPSLALQGLGSLELSLALRNLVLAA